VTSPRDGSRSATGEGTPPVAATWKMPVFRLAKRMRPSSSQDPPLNALTSQIFDSRWRDRSICCNTECAEKAIDRPSGDQKG
jgi:hypothetical protein